MLSNVPNMKYNKLLVASPWLIQHYPWWSITMEVYSWGGRQGSEGGQREQDSYDPVSLIYITLNSVSSNVEGLLLYQQHPSSVTAGFGINQAH